MKRETIVPSIPDVRGDNATDLLRAIKSTLDVREGRVGDPLDQYVTLRDLTDIGIASLGGSSTLTSGARVPVVVPGAGADGYDPATDLTTPAAPTGLVATAGFSNVYLSWDGAPYRNHAYTEIWRSSTNNLGSAVRVGTTISNVYADPAAEGTTYYYWIRFVSVADLSGAYNSTAGTAVTTATSPAVLLNLLTNQITESQLYSSLGARIDLIDGSAPGSVNYRIAQEATTRSAADGHLFAQYTVKIDYNGYVTGFGLASIAVDGVPTSSFLVRADSFAIANPSGPSIPPSTPFIVRTTGTVINGEYVPPGVYMTDAFIQNGTISSAKIGSLTADKITTGTLTAAISVNTGVIYGGVNPVGWAPGSPYFGTGFLLGSYQGSHQFFVGTPDKNIAWNGADLTVKGVVYASAGSFTGSIYAGSGTIGGNTINSSAVSSPGYSAGSAGWSLNSNGSVEFQNATVRGVIRSTDGKFVIDAVNKFIRIEV